MSEKYQREIEDILGRIEEPQLQDARRNGRGWAMSRLRAVRRLLGRRGWKLSPGRIMLGSMSLLLVALLLRANVPGLVAPLAWAAVVLFIAGYALFFINPHPVYEKRWRGRLIESPPRWWERFLGWIRGR